MSKPAVEFMSAAETELFASLREPLRTGSHQFRASVANLAIAEEVAYANRARRQARADDLEKARRLVNLLFVSVER